MRAALVIGALLWPQLVLAEETVTDADIASLVAAIETRGCVLASSNDPTLLEDSNLSQETMLAAANALLASGKASVVYDQLVLLTDKCPALDETTTEALKPDRARFITVVEVNGCKMTNDEADALLPKAGFTPEVAGPIVEGLLAEGLAVMDETEFTLKTGKCN